MRVVDFSGIYTQLEKETETFAPGIISSFVLLTSRFGHLPLVSRYICSYLPSRTCPSWAFLPNPLFCVYAIFQSCILATLIFLLCIFCIKYVMYSKMFLSMWSHLTLKPQSQIAVTPLDEITSTFTPQPNTSIIFHHTLDSLSWLAYFQYICNHFSSLSLRKDLLPNSLIWLLTGLKISTDTLTRMVVGRCISLSGIKNWVA